MAPCRPRSPVRVGCLPCLVRYLKKSLPRRNSRVPSWAKRQPGRHRLCRQPPPGSQHPGPPQGAWPPILLLAPCRDLRVIAAVYPSLSNWIAPSSLGISYIHELKGRRIAIGPQDSSTALSARIVLDAAGITETNSILKNDGLGSGSEGILSGSLDAVHGFAGVPISGFSQLADAMPCTILRYTDQELDSILSENYFYYRDVIPAKTYPGQDRDVDTFGIKCLLCVDQDMDEGLVYELTSILYENAGSLGRQHPSLFAMSRDRFMYSALPIPLHPGAERFYWEKGLLSETHGKME